MAKIDSAYHYYLSTYGSSSMSRYDTHKKSQLRDIYNRIIKLNKESPLYKISDTEDAKKVAINIKESARSIQNIVASLSSDSEDGIESIFQKKVATTTDESIVSAEYTGSTAAEENATSFLIEVKQLASPQVNTGNFLDRHKSDLSPGTYSFDLNTTSTAYEFQFNVGKGDNNYEILDKLSNLISNADIGLHSDVITNSAGKVALRIESNQTGLPEGATSIFQIMPQADNTSIQTMGTLGIDRITVEPHNSQFILNGNECSSLANTFTVDEVFRVTLNDVCKANQAIEVGFKPNAEAVADNIEKLTDAYNHILSVGEEQATEQNNTKFLKEMMSVSFSQKSSLDSIGLEVDSLGNIHVNRETLADTVTSNRASECFDILNRFKENLSSKASNASLDPMNYVNKVIVVYKNPGKNFAAPYITSIYSGMMIDRYC